MARRPFTSGLGTTTWRSKRPGRMRALSSDSGKLVAATTITPSVGLKPSISTSIWFSVICTPTHPSSSHVKTTQTAEHTTDTNYRRTWAYWQFVCCSTCLDPTKSIMLGTIFRKYSTHQEYMMPCAHTDRTRINTTLWHPRHSIQQRSVTGTGSRYYCYVSVERPSDKSAAQH